MNRNRVLIVLNLALWILRRKFIRIISQGNLEIRNQEHK